jgi:fatty acid desaturase
VTHLKMTSDSAKNAQATARRYYLVRAVYLAAIGVATLGWLWLIAWVALQLIYSL